jgi:phosphoglycerol transferase MdoB-like AlkP superfamily enzyme
MDIAHVVQSSVAPVFLLTGVASTLGVLTNRLARVVDRARALEEQLEQEPARRGALIGDLRVLERRARYINTAISMCAVAALLVALVVVSLFADVFLGVELARAVALLFIAAMLCLAVAYVAFFVEIRLAIVALRIGIPHK